MRTSSPMHSNNPRNPSGYTRIDCNVIARTSAAIRLDVKLVNGNPIEPDVKNPDWYPLSQIKSITNPPPPRDDPEIENQDEPVYTVVMLADWLVQKRGM